MSDRKTLDSHPIIVNHLDIFNAAKRQRMWMMSQQDVSESARTAMVPPSSEVAEHGAAMSLDYANLSPDELLASYWAFVFNPMSDVATVIVNTFDATQAMPIVNGKLAELVAVAFGLRKAYGRSIKVATIRTDLGIDLPDGYSPTFELYLSAARLRVNHAADRKTDNLVRKTIRDRVRKARKGQ